MDQNGRWNWFEAEPWCSKKHGIWFTRRHLAKVAADQLVGSALAAVDWATTKQRRPED